MTRLICLIGAIFLSGCAASAKPAILEIDARQAERRIFHSHLLLPIQPGEQTLYFPKWLPGAHTPCGAVNGIVGLKLSAGGMALSWRRDDVDMFAFHCIVPAGVDELDIRLDFISPVIESKGFTSRFTSAATTNLALINWESMLFYLKGQKVDEVLYQTRLQLPRDWQFATSLPVERRSADAIEFKLVPLVTLVDSPLISGKYFKRFQLGQSAGAMHEIDAVADSEAALEMTPENLAAYKNLPAEAHALFGSHHYQNYNFLLTLSDPLKAGGWEHHECSDNRASEKMLTDENDRLGWSGLLPHEFSHSWNGKFRRPVGLATADYQEPMRGELLWVYEGLTTYLGNVLTARSGLVTYEQARQVLALDAAFLERTPGREWRSLADTAVAAQLTYESPREWNSMRRGTDFYGEGALVWLEADVIIRQQTQGKKSLDDFCKLFFGGGTSLPEVKTYTLEDVIAALESVSHSDWKQFLNDRIYSTTTHAPLGGIENSGWKIVYKEEPSQVQKASDANDKGVELVFSLGLSIGENGRISDVIPASPADKSGLAPGQKIVAVNGRKYSEDLIRDAVKRSNKTEGPIELIVENEQFMKVFKVDYQNGARHANLERDASKPDLLLEILKPHTIHPATGPATQPK